MQRSPSVCRGPGPIGGSADTPGKSNGFKHAQPDAYRDLDKLVRSTLDGITATSAVIQGRRRYGQDGHLKDDGQVVRLTAFKRYVLAGEEPGGLITLLEATSTDLSA